MKLIAGLGNPGPEYRATRHNVGFEVIDRLATRLGVAAAGDFDRVARAKFAGLCLEASLEMPRGPERVMLLKPMTYMNLSGDSVAGAARFYKIEPADVLVVVDELALPAGRIRLRASGSDGGHNGLRDVQRTLGTGAYPRLRIGIDPAPPPMTGKDYVLGRFSPDQRSAVEPALSRAADCCLAWIRHGVEAAMNRFNADPAPPKPPAADEHRTSSDERPTSK